MSCPVLTFFNNKGGVGKTSLVYHLAWMFAEQGKRVVCADIDPQANLTAAFLEEDAVAAIWEGEEAGSTIYRCVAPLMRVNDLASPQLKKLHENLFLLPGDVALSAFEDTLSEAWPKSLGDSNLYRPLRILSAFWTVMQQAAEQTSANIILADIGPNLGAINRSVLIATDFVVIPLGADLYSLQGLKNLGPTLKNWRKQWARRCANWEEEKNKNSPEAAALLLPPGRMLPLGYLCQQYGVRLERPVKAYDKWVQRIPAVYREKVLGEKHPPHIRQEDDPCCLATIKHYRSLVPMGQEHRKPIFDLTSADGAIGSHANAVRAAREDFATLADTIWARMRQAGAADA
ncbi:MAG TPA: AAA family ATPase [Candidatus Avidesulfovibrio excrementigallinarum]|nr:AAA family ATPase [Candidatus Avidesulfovibrio excrementigallinarum]